MWSDGISLLHLLDPFFFFFFAFVSYFSVFVLFAILAFFFLYFVLFWGNGGVCVRLMVCKVRVENAKHWVTSCLCMMPDDAVRTACSLQ